eukprot:gnl/Spiro4/22190_TR10926_c0_g1_i1.p5 gnl/Spiro4/22190_TR10926_c0_g1~~gnl/Spiro4/22190_TR10926_c0_g1_i1.p5  ORF type:complete len:112 (-),score=21.05 gnl/Spiro4/22190_TR10926_c0_g1_i1:634-969(-)
MPMGWNYSMHIAQSTAEALAAPLAPHVVTYVDGFLVGGSCADECAERPHALMARLDYVRASINLDKSHLTPSTCVVFAGIEMDLKKKRCPSWVESIRPTFKTGGPTRAAVA